jgi:transcriptional regulator MraZ
LVNLIGTYDCKVDSKGRLLFPSDLKAQLSEELENGFVIKRSVFMKCLELYPMSEWAVESEKVSKKNRFVKKNVDFIRKFMAGVRMVGLDKTNRLLIPRDLITFANITKEIVLTSVVNKIEIWEKQAYEKEINYDPDEFAEMAEDVMGNTEESE